MDDHATVVDAGAERVWAALGGGGPRETGAPTRFFAHTILAVEPAERRGPPLTEGSSNVGFRVVRAESPAELAMEGRHRFSRYSLVFRLEPQGPERTLLRAETRAAFPGAAGGVYRALVIGTRLHVLAVRRMLRSVKARAERPLP